MKQKRLQTICYVILAIAFIALLGFAGNSDYEDALRTEALNNGAYNSISAAHPDWDESQVLDYYADTRNN